MPRYNPTTPHGTRNIATPKSNKKQSSFSFPILEIKDILCCLDELGFKQMTESELLHCEKNVVAVRHFFENSLEILTGVRKDEINQPVFSAHQNLEYSQLHEVSIPELAFWRHISKLMEVCGISDFTREDIIRPSWSRLKKQLSALINFAKFRDERLAMYEEVTASRDQQLERLASIDKENAELQENLEKLRDNTKAQRQEMKELSDATHEAMATLAKKNEDQSSLRHASQRLKQENSELREKLNALEGEYGTLTAEMKKLQGQVVQSPERVRREMLESQRALQSERREGEASEQAALQAQAAAKAVADAVKKVGEAVYVADELVALSETCVELGATVKKSERVISNMDKQQTDVVERCKEVERRSARLIEKSKQLEATSQSKVEYATQVNNELTASLMDQRRKKATEASAYTEEDSQCEQIEAALEADMKEHRKAMGDLVIAWRGLHNTLSMNTQTVAQECQIPVPGPHTLEVEREEFGDMYDAYSTFKSPVPTHQQHMNTTTPRNILTPLNQMPSPYQSSHFNSTQVTE